MSSARHLASHFCGIDFPVPTWVSRLSLDREWILWKLVKCHFQDFADFSNRSIATYVVTILEWGKLESLLP